jgi:hypothetical protein
MSNLARKLMVSGVSFTPLTIELTSSANNSGSFTSGNFTSRAIGDAPTGGNRRFVFFVMGGINTSANRNMTSCTIASQSTSIIVSVSSTATVNIAWAEVATGTSITIAAGFNGALDGYAYNVYVVRSGPGGITVGTPETSTATTTTITFNLTTANGGVVLGAATSRSTSSNNWTWSNLTENYEVDFNSSDVLATATAQTTGTSLSVGIIRNGTYAASSRAAVAMTPA